MVGSLPATATPSAVVGVAHSQNRRRAAELQTYFADITESQVCAYTHEGIIQRIYNAQRLLIQRLDLDD